MAIFKNRLSRERAASKLAAERQEIRSTVRPLAPGHDLLRLGELAGAAGVNFPPGVLDAIRRLGRHYIPARYPDAHPSGPAGAHYAEADSAEAIQDAEAVLRAVDEAWRSLA